MDAQKSTDTKQRIPLRKPADVAVFETVHRFLGTTVYYKIIKG